MHIKNLKILDFIKIINICNGLDKKILKGDKFLTKNRHGRLRTADPLHVKQVLYPWATRLDTEAYFIVNVAFVKGKMEPCEQ